MTKVKVELSNQTIARLWLILIGFLLGIALVYWARFGLILLGVAIFLATALNPIVANLAKKLFKGKRLPATTLAFLGVIIIVVVLGYLVVPMVINQTTGLIKTAPEAVANLVTQTIENSHHSEQWFLRSVATEVVKWADSNKTRWAADIGNNLFLGIGSVISSLTATVLVLVMSFLILIDAPNIMRYIWGFYRRDDRRRQHQNLVGKMYRVVTGFVSGQLTVAIIDGLFASVLVFILYLIFDFPMFVIAPIGLLVMLLVLLPMIGIVIAIVLGALILLLYSWQAALVFVICFILYQQIEGNIIAPMIQSKKIELSTLVIVVAIVMGLYMFGVLGGVIAIPLAGCIKVLLDNYRATLIKADHK